MIAFKKTLLIFGGEKREGPEHRHRACVNETKLFNPGRK